MFVSGSPPAQADQNLISYKQLRALALQEWIQLYEELEGRDPAEITRTYRLLRCPICRQSIDRVHFVTNLPPEMACAITCEEIQSAENAVQLQCGCVSKHTHGLIISKDAFAGNSNSSAGENSLWSWFEQNGPEINVYRDNFMQASERAKELIFKTESREALLARYGGSKGLIIAIFAEKILTQKAASSFAQSRLLAQEIQEEKARIKPLFPRGRALPTPAFEALCQEIIERFERQADSLFFAPGSALKKFVKAKIWWYCFAERLPALFSLVCYEKGFFKLVYLMERNRIPFDAGLIDPIAQRTSKIMAWSNELVAPLRELPIVESKIIRLTQHFQSLMTFIISSLSPIERAFMPGTEMASFLAADKFTIPPRIIAECRQELTTFFLAAPHQDCLEKIIQMVEAFMEQLQELPTSYIYGNRSAFLDYAIRYLRDLIEPILRPINQAAMASPAQDFMFEQLTPLLEKIVSKILSVNILPPNFNPMRCARHLFDKHSQW
jgi:hypothetical protein